MLNNPFLLREEETFLQLILLNVDHIGVLRGYEFSRSLLRRWCLTRGFKCCPTVTLQYPLLYRYRYNAAFIYMNLCKLIYICRIASSSYEEVNLLAVNKLYFLSAFIVSSLLVSPSTFLCAESIHPQQAKIHDACTGKDEKNTWKPKLALDAS